MRGRDVDQLSDGELDRLIELRRSHLANVGRSGIYIRRRWGTSAVIWGGLLPLCLFAAAGFVAFGGRKAGQ
jgi:hypothetical protein